MSVTESTPKDVEGVFQEVLNLLLCRINGKGQVRHGKDTATALKEMQILHIRDMVGSGHALGQVIKKVSEAVRLEALKPHPDALAELLDAAAYLLFEIGARLLSSDKSTTARI